MFGLLTLLDLMAHKMLSVVITTHLRQAISSVAKTLRKSSHAMLNPYTARWPQDSN